MAEPEKEVADTQHPSMVGRMAVVWTTDEENIEGRIIRVSHIGVFLKTEDDEEASEYMIPFTSITYMKFLNDKKR